MHVTNDRSSHPRLCFTMLSMYLPAQFTEIPVFFAKEFVSRASSLRFYFLRDGKVGQVTIFQFIYLFQSESAQCCFQIPTSLLKDVW